MIKLKKKNYQLIYSTGAVGATGNFNSPINLSYNSEENYDGKKPVATAAVATPDKNSNENSLKPNETLLTHEPIHLPPIAEPNWRVCFITKFQKGIQIQGS
jgi:hypothetical protein